MTGATGPLPLPILAVNCPYCGQARNPREVMRIGTGGALMCWQCHERHVAALHALASGIAPACAGCGASREALCAQSADGECRMYLHPKDGIYQLLCPACSGRYIRQRADLYGSTRFGYKNKLR